jgi:hypothetical protein
MTQQELLEHYRRHFPKGLRGMLTDSRVRVLCVARQRTDMPAVLWEAQDSSATGWCDADYFEKHFTPDPR